MGRMAHTPNFQEIMAIIKQRAYHLLPPLPHQYLAPAPTTHPAGTATKGPRSVGPAPWVPGSTAPDNCHDLGQRINNPSIVPEWLAAFNNSSTTIRALREFNPNTHDRDTHASVPICLSYQVWGSCYGNCQRASMHSTLSAAECRSMSAFVHHPMTRNPGGGGGGGGGAASSVSMGTLTSAGGATTTKGSAAWPGATIE